jgi:hypothetical protein
VLFLLEQIERAAACVGLRFLLHPEQPHRDLSERLPRDGRCGKARVELEKVSLREIVTALLGRPLQVGESSLDSEVGRGACMQQLVAERDLIGVAARKAGDLSEWTLD